MRYINAHYHEAHWINVLCYFYKIIELPFTFILGSFKCVLTTADQSLAKCKQSIHRQCRVQQRLRMSFACADQSMSTVAQCVICEYGCKRLFHQELVPLPDIKNWSKNIFVFLFVEKPERDTKRMIFVPGIFKYENNSQRYYLQILK